MTSRVGLLEAVGGVLLLLPGLTFSATYGESLQDASISAALRRVQFANEGTTRANDSFFFANIEPLGEAAKLVYLEADNVSCTQCVWSDGGKYYVDHPYLFRVDPTPAPAPSVTPAPSPSPVCNASAIAQGDRPGDDIAVHNFPLGTNVSSCTDLCCETSGCEAYVFIANLTQAYQNCATGTACCWLKDGVPGPAPCPAVYNDACRSGTVQSPPPPPPPPIKGVSPASGMRSAVPLGGLSTGSVELRGDGSLHEWIIHNAGPSGAAKIQQYPKAFFAMKVDENARVLQTHPAVNGGNFGVSSLKYQGSHPVSKLTIEPDETASQRGNHTMFLRHRQHLSDHTVALSAALYGFSTLSVGDRVASARPAVAFPLDVHNAGTGDANIGLLFNLPLLVEEDQARPGTALGSAVFTEDAEACAMLCKANSSCLSWVWTAPADAGGGAIAPAKCQLQSDAPLNRYQKGVTSGIPGSWVVEGAQSQCLTLVRPGSGPMHGNVSICASSSDSQATFRAIVADTAEAVFDDFAAHGAKAGEQPTVSDGIYGAVAVEGTAAAGGDLVLSLTLGWCFPNRDHYNYAAPGGAGFVPYGNHYATLYPSAAESAASMPLEGTLDAIYAWHSALFPAHGSANNEDRNKHVSTALTSNADRWTLPSWLSDVLINSLSHTRDMMWWSACPHCHVSADGRVNGTLSPGEGGFWRQFEAYDCPDLDSIHNDGERHIPYIMFFPNGTRSKLAAWAGNQGSDGMLAEQILNTDPDSPQGRVMSDSSSMFVLYVLELLKWDGDRTSLDLYYPAIKKIVAWQLSKSSKFGVPLGLETTYDVLNFPQYQLSAYATVFHLAVLAAGAELAQAKNDTAFETQCKSGLTRAQAAFDALQWNATESFYNAGSSGCTAGDPASGKGGGCTQGIGYFSDAFYAQNLAYAVGLGDLVSSPTNLDRHQDQTLAQNCKHVDESNNSNVPGCPYGLLIMSGRAPGVADNTIWEMATHDYAALRIRRHAADDAAIEAALALSQGSVSSYAELMNDQWNIAGGKFSNGYPAITSHYGYHMTVWHVLLALNGQDADLSHFEVDGTATLSFDPKVSCEGDGFEVPFLLPGRVGTVACTGAKTVTVQLTVGQLALSSLSVFGKAYPGGAVTLQAGEPVTWEIA